jgi:hypothetical protein
VTVIVDEEPAVTEDGEKLADAPLGSPLALSDTDCALPEVTAVETVAVVLEPAAMLREPGLTEIEKSFAGALVTVSVNVVECVALAPVPVIVTV